MVVNAIAILGCLIFASDVIVSADRHFAGNEEVHDEGHIKQHLEDKIDVSKLSEEQKRFHYFSISDLNKDNYIDGNEILKALTHDHAGDTGPGVPLQDEETMVQMIDSVLADMDVNGDGYIDFPEYMREQSKNSARSS